MLINVIKQVFFRNCPQGTSPAPGVVLPVEALGDELRRIREYVVSAAFEEGQHPQERSSGRHRKDIRIVYCGIS